MDLYLQFGWGMIKHTEVLLGEWKSGGVILSPRDLEPRQLQRVVDAATSNGAEPLLDPQCFSRHADHDRLNRHAYWSAVSSANTTALTEPEGAGRLVDAIDECCDALGIDRRILPGLLASSVDEDWLAIQASVANAASARRSAESLLSTVALSSEAIRNENEIERVIESARDWPVGGYYIVAETPAAYLVDDPIWLANLLILAGGLRLHGRQVLVGYANHQFLPLAACGVSALASGTYLNVRAFQPDKFFVSAEEEVSRRAKGGWYYCPQALSEYKMPFLDVSMRKGCLDLMAPSSDAAKRWGAALFTGAQPSGVNWGEQNAFRHYLSCLREQAGAASRVSFDESLSAYTQGLAESQSIVGQLRENGVFGQDREFTDFFDVGLSAAGILESSLGPRLRRL